MLLMTSIFLNYNNTYFSWCKCDAANFVRQHNWLSAIY